ESGTLAGLPPRAPDLATHLALERAVAAGDGNVPVAGQLSQELLAPGPLFRRQVSHQINQHGNRVRLRSLRQSQRDAEPDADARVLEQWLDALTLLGVADLTDDIGGDGASQRNLVLDRLYQVGVELALGSGDGDQRLLDLLGDLLGFGVGEEAEQRIDGA